MTQPVKERLAPLLGKNPPLVLIGPSGAGKSTLISGMAKSDIVRGYLMQREARGKGSLISEEIIVTDAQNLCKDELYVTGVVKPTTPSMLADDNVFIGKILYSGALESQQNGAYMEKLLKAYNNELKDPANDSLAYKVMSMEGGTQRERIFKTLSAFPEQDIRRHFCEARDLEKVHNKRPPFAQNKFAEALTEDIALSEPLNKCYREMANCLNEESNHFREQIANKAIIEDCGDGEWRFYLALDVNFDKEVASILLKSESGSKEYLFSDLTLVFRGAPWIFSGENIDVLTVGEINGVSFRALRLIDTMGLFHSSETGVGQECERIVDILTRYHASSVLFVRDINEDTMAKHANAVMREFLRTVKINASVRILFTKLDEYLVKNVYTGRQIWHRPCVQQTKAELGERCSQTYDAAKKAVQECAQSFLEALEGNDSKHKPATINVDLCGLLAAEKQVTVLLATKHCLQINAIFRARTWLCEQADKVPKIRVKNVEQLIAKPTPNPDEKNAGKVREDLIKSKELKLYASTVAAVNRKWQQGAVHRSCVAANDWGYANIETVFVPYIGNYGRELLDGNITLTRDCFLNPDDLRIFQDAVEKERTRLGKLFAAEIHKDVYQRGFQADSDTYKYQYERFRRMLALTLDDYFPKTPTPPTAQTKKCLEKALKKLVNEIVDYHCIVVY